MATRLDFAKALLNRLGIPQTHNRLVGLVAFAAIEGGHWAPNLRGTHNPMNTTLATKNSHRLSGFAAAIQSYPDWPTGLEATARTMAQPNMRPIIDALKADVDPQAFMHAITQSAWCPGCSYDQVNAQALYNQTANIQEPGGGTAIDTSAGVNWPWVLGIGALLALVVGGVWYWKTGTFFGLGSGHGHSFARLLGAGENPTSGSKKSGSKVQTLIFSRDRYTPTQAKAWAKKHGYRAGKVHVTGDNIRLRQRAPGGRMRTIKFGKGIKAVVSFK